MDQVAFNRELAKYKVVRPDDYIKEQRKVKRSVAKTPLIRNGDKTQVVERKLTINEKDAFWEILEVILREKANLSRTEVTNFVNIMKKSKAEMMELVNLDDLNAALQ